MAKFRIHTHSRLQEWVAEERGYFKDEGLDYQFGQVASLFNAASVGPADAAPAEVRHGAFESYEDGRACEVSSACHWVTNMAAATQHGQMWGKAYSVCTSGIYVAPESPIKTAEDLAGVEIAVGYHSGSHFATLQALQPVIGLDKVKLSFAGGPNARVEWMLERKVPAATVFGLQLYVLECQGFRKVVDTTFMMGFLLSKDASPEDTAKYFRALQRAQRDIDLQPERYKHHFLKELPEQFRSLVDVRKFGTGERIVFEPYTREMFETTQQWLKTVDVFAAEREQAHPYQEAILV
ncbi:MAG: ABC transporter substrate-binding protein [Chloroflexota bacterium]|nr:ABC transporter substrate-binding protein [Chloroflexota bacterium]